jgi:hypothetical protein
MTFNEKKFISDFKEKVQLYTQKNTQNITLEYPSNPPCSVEDQDFKLRHALSSLKYKKYH